MPPKPAIAAEEATVLPLPLTPFEVYYSLDDSREYPTTFPVLLRFRGTLDREAFVRALRGAVARQPLLSARVEQRRGGPHWVAVDAEPVIDWAGTNQPLGSQDDNYLDLRSLPGLRTWVRADAHRANVVFQFHHACCDGLSALQFARDVLALYRYERGDGDSEHDNAAGGLAAIDPSLLRLRGTIASDEPRQPVPLQGLRDAWYTLKVWAAILFRGPEVLAAPRDKEPSPKQRELLEFEIETLSSDESAGLRKLAKSLGITTNDLLIRDWVRVLRNWNLRESGASRGSLRINVPVNVRTRAELEMPAANRIGYAFVTVPAGDNSPAAVLEIVRSETRRIKEWKLALYFLGGLATARLVPGLLPWAMRRRRSFATAVLSNVGRYPADVRLPPGERWTCGDLTLEWFGGVPPVRQLTSAALFVIEYGGEASFALRTDPQLFDQAGTRRLLGEFAEQVRQTLRDEI